jgi:hypothetical protein
MPYTYFPIGVQVYEGDGVKRYTGLKKHSWKLWRGVRDNAGFVEETEEFGRITNPGRDIPSPPDRLRDCNEVYMTDHDGHHWHWDRNGDQWKAIDKNELLA